jgi:hypothetical protein
MHSIIIATFSSFFLARAFVARNAIVDFVNPFFVVLSKDIRRRMLVTTIASIGAIIVIQVAGTAFSIVVLIK